MKNIEQKLTVDRLKRHSNALELEAQRYQRKSYNHFQR